LLEVSRHLPRRRRSQRFTFALVSLCWLLFLAVAIAPFLIAQPTSAAPAMILPTPPGETWKIIQGYGCGTHNAWDHYSLDIASANGNTYGAPVRVVADGTLWIHDGSSGTLIIDHGGNFYTMYTHMSRVATTREGTFFAQGTIIGAVGDIGTRGNPHLHFTAFTASSQSMRSWKSQPVRFAETGDLPEIGGCNQHGGRALTADSQPAPEVHFSTSLEPGRWYNQDDRIEFAARYANGFGQGWNTEPPADAPMFPDAPAGYANLMDKGEGMHTLHVRAFSRDGRSTLASFGPVGYDVTPPSPVKPFEGTVVLSGTADVLNWLPSSDKHSGLAGYRVYLGPDLNGESDWFVEEAVISVADRTPGRYILRIQTLDKADNAGDWVTVATVEIRE
jgi:murein DD-endopeptidase MepM/ murein hydrolase activator NlpD